MKELNVNMEFCYGIKKLNYKFIFSNRTFSIYAPNGVMKTSFAKTFKDFSQNQDTKDIPFPERITKREITADVEINSENIFIIEPYNQDYESEKMSTLLGNAELKKEYELIHKEIDKLKDDLLKKIKETSGLGRYEDIINNIETSFNNSFFDALVQLKNILNTVTEKPYLNIKYPIIFNNNVLKFLKTSDFKNAIKEYIEKYSELLNQSKYLKNDFSFYHAENVQKQLASNNFFKAGHSVNLLNGENKEEYKTDKELQELLNNEKKKIMEDETLKKKFDEINDKLTNADLRTFRDFLLTNKHILIELSNIEEFSKKVWTSYIINEKELSLELIKKYESGQNKIHNLIINAKKEKTAWEEVVRIFNTRFSHLPFSLSVINKEDVILKDQVPTITFVFKDGVDEKKYDNKNELLEILSTGEKRALYILNIIFEVEARKNCFTNTLFVIDDVADSFDYKNKYAIIEYLKYMCEIDCFFMIILTHNFDFFRTIQSRGIVPYNQCLIAIKNTTEITLINAKYLKNPFINDWKNNLTDSKKLVASIPFIRNIIEYTQDVNNADYLILTSVLHYKNNSKNLTLDEIKNIFCKYIQNINFPNLDFKKKIIEFIFECADSCLIAEEGINLENKIVLSIAIRLKAEQFMKSKITDLIFLNDIDTSKNQTWTLLKKYQEEFNNDFENIDILKKVNLITPENIHLNSFMYEPILDMGDNELRDLFAKLKSLEIINHEEDSQNDTTN